MKKYTLDLTAQKEDSSSSTPQLWLIKKIICIFTNYLAHSLPIITNLLHDISQTIIIISYFIFKCRC
jgi:hypothetical protein